jgi:pimeloyl-ACP methyl ester carboxylesterase
VADSDTPSRITVDAGPVRLSALDYGNLHLPTMVVLHGLADLAWSMDSVARAFADRFHVISFDLRGHGESDHPGAYSLSHFVADARNALATQVHDQPVIVAHSLGGHVAALYAGLYPSVPRALVLVEGAGPPAQLNVDSPEARADLVRAHLDVLGAPLAHKPLVDIDAAVARLAAAHPRLDPERARFLAEVGTKPGPDGGLVWKFDPRTRDWMASIDHRFTEECWRATVCPVLAIGGADSWDTWWSARVPPAAQVRPRIRMAPAEWSAKLTAFPDVEEVELADAGHMVQFDQPERLNEVIADFLDRRL